MSDVSLTRVRRESDRGSPCRLKLAKKRIYLQTEFPVTQSQPILHHAFDMLSNPCR